MNLNEPVAPVMDVAPEPALEDVMLEEPVEELTPPVTPDAGNLIFEDHFPPLDLNEEQKDSIVSWLLEDLRSCVRHVNSYKEIWSTYRSIFLLEYVEKFYPSMGFSANFASGLLCEKVLALMTRLKRAVLTPRPLFVADDKTSNIEDIEFLHRSQWFLHTVFEEDLDIHRVMGPQAFFEFGLDGSMIMEADQMYEKIPQRTIKTYVNEDELVADKEKILDASEFDEALLKINGGQPARVLIEQDMITKDGLQLFLVDKVDHLIPPNEYEDRNIRFRGRRMYLTESDLNLLASDGVNWYKKEDVAKVLGMRANARSDYGQRHEDKDAGQREQVRQDQSTLLGYDWRESVGEDERLAPNRETLPYKNTFAVYRVLAKYGYTTGKDPKGLIPKYCLFDVEPESRTLLRARTYPHFHERPPYFHFKLGYAPKSYYGFGYGARLSNDDMIESNALDLYFDGAAMATFKPFLCVHPEDGGRVPFRDGLGPHKLGFLRNMADFKELDIKAPPVALVQHILPITKTRAENKTSVTSLVQGQTESSDPRSPAAKTRMLLGEAGVGIEDQIEDFNNTGWSPMADFVWVAQGELLVYQEQKVIEDKIIFPGMAPDLEQVNRITLEELQRKVNWKGQASSIYLNSEAREADFLRQFQFVTPLLQILGQINPELYKKYFLRWMRQAGQELDIRGFRFLFPTAEELGDMPQEQLSQVQDSMLTMMQSGQTPEMPQLEGNK